MRKKNKKLSIIIPVYNEENTIEKSLNRIVAVKLGKWDKELIIVDDGSKDKSKVIIQRLFAAGKKTKSIMVLTHKKNKGKGAAIQTALKHVSGDAVIVQDADLEYNPNDIPKLLKELEKGKAQIVLGS